MDLSRRNRAILDSSAGAGSQRGRKTLISCQHLPLAEPNWKPKGKRAGGYRVRGQSPGAQSGAGGEEVGPGGVEQMENHQYRA